MYLNIYLYGCIWIYMDIYSYDYMNKYIGILVYEYIGICYIGCVLRIFKNLRNSIYLKSLNE